MRITAAGRTDVGKVRTENEDSYGVYPDLGPDLGLFIVADGLGGHAGGKVASQLAVDEMHRVALAWPSEPQRITGRGAAGRPEVWPAEFASLPDAAKRLLAALAAANQAVLKGSSARPDLAGMATTVVAVMIEGMTAHLAHVGDSRAYVIRPAAPFQEARLLQLTEDHSVVGEYIAQGLMSREAAKVSPYKHLLSRAVGLQDDLPLDLRTMALKAGDRLLLCSDGLTNMLRADAILATVLAARDVEAACEALVARANDEGGEDNITAVMVALSDG